MRSAAGTLVFAVLVAGAAAHGQALLAPGGAGDSGGAGGAILIEASDAVVAGAGAKVKAPKAPKVPTKADLVAVDQDMNLLVEIADLDAHPADLDPDPFQVTARGNVLVPAGTTLLVEGDAAIVSTQGGVFVVGDVEDADGSEDGAELQLISIRKAVVVQGDVDLDGEAGNAGGDGGGLELAGAQVTIAGGAVVNARGGDASGGGEDGGFGGRVLLRPSNPLVQGKIAVQLGDGAVVDLRGGRGGTGGGGDGGDGGEFDVGFSDILGNPSALTLAGRVDVRGGNAQADAGAGGDGGTIEADVGGPLAVTGGLEATGGAGPAGSEGGSGGQIELGGRAIGKGPVSILVPGSSAVDVSVAGGDGNDGSGGSGGVLFVQADLRGIQWTGDLAAHGGASTDDDGAAGGEVSLTSYGPRAPVRVDGAVTAQGSDAHLDGVGSAGGDVALVSLDGGVELTGGANTSAGHAAGNNRDASGDGGDLFLLADDANGLPGAVGGIDLLDDVGGGIVVLGSLSARGGDGGGGDSDGSNGGMITVDSDGDDGEEPDNGPVEIGDDVQIDARGGAGTGSGEGGDGGILTVRGSNGDEDGAATGAILGINVGLAVPGGAGGTPGASGTITLD